MWKATDLFAVNVPAENVPFAVPVESLTGQVGPDYVKHLAKLMEGSFERNPIDIGLMDDMSVLEGKWFNPSKVHPLIREFYEHTTRFTMSVRPVWHRFFLPAFWLFRNFFAERVGQFNLPFDIHEARQGIESHIDCVDLNHDRIQDIRGWVRTYTGTNRTVYVGIYTTVRLKDLGYVTIGFPLPNSNLTATLVPANHGKHNFILKSRRRGARFAGDYIVFPDEKTQRMCVFRIRGFKEEIYVYVRNERLFTNHRFYFLGCRFLTLIYTIDRKLTPPSQQPARELLLEAPTLKPAA
jgi:hypothetical protein